MGSHDRPGMFGMLSEDQSMARRYAKMVTNEAASNGTRIAQLSPCVEEKIIKRTYYLEMVLHGTLDA